MAAKDHVDEMKELTSGVTELIGEFWHSLEDLSPAGSTEPGHLLDQLPLEAPQHPDKWQDLLDDVRKMIIPNMPHLSSPNYHGYVEIGTSAPCVAAAQLIAALTSPTCTWHANGTGTELEMRMTDWLGRILGLPDQFLFSSGIGNGGGVIQESASGSCILMLVAAKRRALDKLRQTDKDLDPYDVSSKFVALMGDQAHSSIERSGFVAGIRTHILPTDETGSLRAQALLDGIAEVKSLGRIPIFLGVTLGSTTTLAFDALAELAPICNDEGIWVHVDAAIAGSAFLCPEFRHLMAGIELADSFNCGPHKTMLVTMSCSVLWVKDRTTVESSLAIDPPYLDNHLKKPHVDYRHWSFNLTRPFRSLKLWFVIRLFGVQGLQDHIRKQSRLVKEFAHLVSTDARFELCAEAIYSHACFRLKKSDNETNRNLLNQINMTRKVVLTGSVFKEKYILRFAVSSPFTESKHVEFAWKIITEAANELKGADTDVLKD
nr:aromatic-L-amino-acid decarboxylase-like [Lytechinus pictus]